MTKNDFLVEQYITWKINPENDKSKDSKFSSSNSLSLASFRKILTETKIDYHSRIVDERRAKYKPQMLEIDKAMFKKALEGDVKAATLLYQKYDGWNPKLIEINDNRKYTFIDIMKRLSSERPKPDARRRFNKAV